ncbi:MAG: VOC family protein [Sphingomonadales bacterium]|nr:VOC family protein [Sphingomonadales bacterium]
MIKPNGVHHIAFMTADMKTQIEFFTDVLGCHLIGLFDMHGVPGGLHGFLHLADDCLFSLVQLPAVKDVPIQLGVTHAGSGSGTSAPGTMQHLALKVSNREQLLAIRDRIRKKGVNVFGPINHGMCQSIYFAGPEQMALEIAFSDEALDPKVWIDPTVLAKLDINAEEAARYMAPDDYSGEGGTVPQPPIDPAKPHLAMAEAAYRAVMGMPDDAIWEKASYAEPPVKVG